MIRQLTFKNYKSFKAKQTIDFKPLTVFVGPNSAGKSSIFKLLKLLKQSNLCEDEIIYNGNEYNAGDFHSISHNGVSQQVEVSALMDSIYTLSSFYNFDKYNDLYEEESIFGLPCKFKWNIQNKNAVGYFCSFYHSKHFTFPGHKVFSYFGLGRKMFSNKEIWKKMLLKPINLEDQHLSKDDIFEHIKLKNDSNLLTLVNELGNDGIDPKKGFLIPTFQKTFNNIVFLDPLRPNPKPKYSAMDLKEIFGINIETDGAEKQIYNILKKIGFGCTFNIERHPYIQGHEDTYEIKIKDINNSFSTNLTEVGFGISQILPIVFSIINTHKQTFIEQPELHLHPKAQSSLSKVFIESILDSNKMYTIETHSEHIVRGIQVEIAKGNIPPDFVGIYFVGKRKNGNSYIKRLEVDEKGKFIDKWPNEFFEIGFYQAMELMKAR